MEENETTKKIADISDIKNKSKENEKLEPKKKRLISKKISSSVQKSAEKKEKNDPLFHNPIALTDKEINISSSTTCNKLLENLTKSNYKNNLMESGDNKNNTQKEKEIILKEINSDPISIKKTIEKFLIESKNTISTEKKRKPTPNEKNELNHNSLMKNDKKPEINENILKKQQNSQKKIENTPNPEKKKAPCLVDLLSNSPKGETKINDKNHEDDTFLKFIEDLELHFQGKLDDVVFKNSQNEQKKDAEDCKEKVIILNDFEAKKEDNFGAKKQEIRCLRKKK